MHEGAKRDRHRHGQARVQRSIGVLKHHLHLPVQVAPAQAVCGTDKSPRETNMAAIASDKMHQQPCRRGFAAARLTDDPQGFSIADHKGDIVHRLHDGPIPAQQTALDREMLGQVLDRQKRRAHRATRTLLLASSRFVHSRTSMAWRSPSLIRLKHIDVMKIITPGKAATKGETQSACRKLLSISPHSALGGVTPRPRKLSPAAKMMQMLIRLVA